ncbi:MAG: pyridoxal phosphate-dependent aminotransferase [Methylococcaceae bacterium]|nr:pyridoxal phosphate-dependent aminotransferase [Methylococcaceae bacterium]
MTGRRPDITPFHVMELLGRAKELERAGADVVHLEIGEPDFPTPAPIIQAAQAALVSHDIKYTPAGGLPELRERIAHHYRERYGVDVPARRIFLTPGASGALLLALSALIEPRQRVLLTDPGYPCYRNFVKALHGIPQGIGVAEDIDFQLTSDALERAWSNAAGGLILASPANPTGAIVSRQQLAELTEQIDRRGGFYISDEIYHGLEYGTPCASALELSERSFVINSFSKYFGMTGWRLGWLVVPKDYAELIERLAQNLFIAAPTLSQFAALAAFESGTIAELERRRLEFQRRRDFLHQAMPALGFGLGEPPSGAFYLYADCSKLSADSYRFCEELLESAQVALTPGKDFGELQPERYVRFAYTRPVDQLAVAVERIRNFLG